MWENRNAFFEGTFFNLPVVEKHGKTPMLLEMEGKGRIRNCFWMRFHHLEKLEKSCQNNYQLCILQLATFAAASFGSNAIAGKLSLLKSSLVFSSTAVKPSYRKLSFLCVPKLILLRVIYCICDFQFPSESTPLLDAKRCQPKKASRRIETWEKLQVHFHQPVIGILGQTNNTSAGSNLPL